MLAWIFFFGEPRSEGALIERSGQRRKKFLESKQMRCWLLACHIPSSQPNLGRDREVSVLWGDAKEIPEHEKRKEWVLWVIEIDDPLSRFQKSRRRWEDNDQSEPKRKMSSKKMISNTKIEKRADEGGARMLKMQLMIQLMINHHCAWTSHYPSEDIDRDRRAPSQTPGTYLDRMDSWSSSVKKFMGWVKI